LRRVPAAFDPSPDGVDLSLDEMANEIAQRTSVAAMRDSLG
jgi:hypothetical protein